jgi:plastocyanin
MPASNARRGALALLLAALILFVLGSIEIARAATHAVTISGFAFGPATLTVTAGDTVTWTNDDSVAHTATSTTGAFDTGELEQGESASVTFTSPGTYPYLCTPHPEMTGQIMVVAAAATPTPAAGGGPVPDVAMSPRLQTSPALIAGLLLVGWAGLAAIARRRGTNET